MHIIIGMPPHIIVIGIPAFIMAIMRSQAIFIISADMPSIGFISQVMPVSVMVQVMLHIIIGIIMGIMPFIMFIGIMFMGIMPFIIGIMPAIMFIGIIPIFPIIWLPIGMVIAGLFMISSEKPASPNRPSRES